MTAQPHYGDRPIHDAFVSSMVTQLQDVVADRQARGEWVDMGSNSEERIVAAVLVPALALAEAAVSDHDWWASVLASLGNNHTMEIRARAAQLRTDVTRKREELAG